MLLWKTAATWSKAYVLRRLGHRGRRLLSGSFFATCMSGHWDVPELNRRAGGRLSHLPPALRGQLGMRRWLHRSGRHLCGRYWAAAIG